MKLLIVALLLMSLSAPSVFAQDQLEDPWKAFSRWIEMVKGAEKAYRNKSGRYADLATLRKAHLLDELVFESDSSSAAKGATNANFVRKQTVIKVTVSNNGQHFRAVIGNWCASTIVADDRGYERFGTELNNCPPVRLPLQDGPDGPIISVAR